MRAGLLALTATFAATGGMACSPLRDFPNLATDGSVPPTFDGSGPTPPDSGGALPGGDGGAGDAVGPGPPPDMGNVRSMDGPARSPDGSARPADGPAPPVVRDGGVMVAPMPGSFTAFPIGTYARDIRLAPDGNVYFSHFEYFIGKITPAGEVIPEFRELDDVDPYEIVPTSDGALWVAGSFDNAIARLGPDGSETVFEFDSDNSGPDAMALGPDGNFWFTQAGGENWIGRLTPLGQMTRFNLGNADRDQPNGITAGPDGNLWFTVYLGSLGRITPAGRITIFPMPEAGELGLMHIAAGPDGNLWFTQRSAMKIGRISPAGVISQFALPRPQMTGEPWTDGITLGPDGNLWYAGGDPAVIGRVTPAGQITEFRAPDIFRPERLTFDRNGVIWFTDDNNQIGRFVPPKP
jgi:streptogramin lyase